MKKAISLLFLVSWSCYAFSQQITFPIQYAISVDSIGETYGTDAELWWRNNQYYSEDYVINEGKRFSYTFNSTKLNPSFIKKLYSSFIWDLQKTGIIKNTGHAKLAPTFLYELNKASIESINHPTTFFKLGNYYCNIFEENIRWKDSLAHHSFNIKGEVPELIGVGYNEQGVVRLDSNGFWGDPDTIYLTTPFPPYDESMVISYPWGYPNAIHQLDFIENWKFDAPNGTFIKEVIWTGLKDAIFNNEGACTFKWNPTIGRIISGSDNIIDPSYLFKSNQRYEVLFDTWTNCSAKNFPPNCNDIYSSLVDGDWQNPTVSASDRSQLLLLLFKAIKNKTITALNPLVLDSNKKEVAIKYDDLFDFLKVNSPNGSDQSLANIIGFGFVEDWYIRPTQFSFYKKVKYISLIYGYRDPTSGKLLARSKGVYLKLN